jgi:1-phosphatidylinositol phosphodiesterase
VISSKIMGINHLFRISLFAAWLCATHAKCGPSLAELALQKVLDDSSEVFGIYRASNSTTANWMGAYPDTTPLVQLNIPGTHESATWNFSDATRAASHQDNGTTVPAAYYRCQNQSLADALNAGIRFFDLRYAIDPTFTQLVFWHNAALMSETATVEDVLFGFYYWIEQHPSETVILSFQYEGSTQPGGSNNEQVQRLIFSALTSPAARRYFLQTQNSLGTLGAARGKLILFRRFDLNALPASYDAALPGIHFPPEQWTDDGVDISLVYNSVTNATAYIEDYYEPDDLPANANASISITYKLNATTAHLAKAADPAFADGLFITFASAERTGGTPPIYPEMFATGNGSYTPMGGVNQQLLPIVQKSMGKRLGIVVLDYFGQPPDLVEAVLGL